MFSEALGHQPNDVDVSGWPGRLGKRGISMFRGAEIFGPPTFDVVERTITPA
jgi:hypothetical protein